MQSQRNLAICSGILVGTLVYILYTIQHVDSAFDVYASLRLGGLLVIATAVFIAGRFLFFFKMSIILYEKIRYKGHRPHAENSITKEDSYFIGLLIAGLLTAMAYFIFPSERIIYSVFVGTLVTRIFKTSLMYTTGRPCRLWYPLSHKINRASDIVPEPEIRMYWRPVEVFTVGILFTLYVLTIPQLQMLIVKFFMYSGNALRHIGIF